MVRDIFIQKVIELIPRDKLRDMYANPQTARFPDFYEKAEDGDWDVEDCVRWCNPPFSMWESVAARIQRSLGQFVCLVPDWGQCWLRGLVGVSKRRWYIPSGTALFQLDGVKVGPTRWGCWLIVVLAGQRLSCEAGREFEQVTLLQWNPAVSTGQKRRARAKVVKARVVGRSSL